MKNTPIDYEIVSSEIKNCGIKSVGDASIREIKNLINNIEKETGEKYIRMEMGIPGLKPSKIALEAEKKALDDNCPASYPPLDGLPKLKKEIASFVKNFLDIDIPVNNCTPTVGSINGAYATFMVSGRMNKQKDTVLFLDPGFPVHKQLVKMIGLKQESLDVYNYRGNKLKEKLESILEKGNISTILYANPNNPAWICFNSEELKIIGDLSNKYDIVVAEDLAYFAMDFRQDLSKPGVAPFQASVGKYADKFILMISTSKSFSYAGQRIGLLAISDKLFSSTYDDLLQYYPNSNFGHAFINGTIYCTTAGVTHSAQHGVAALLKAINSGEYNFIEEIKEYGKRATIMKKLFIDNGFDIVYDKDIDEAIADGFYFTVSYNGYTGDQLIEELFYYGISAISLSGTGSERTEGIRACVSLVNPDMFPTLEKRLKIFKENN